MPTAMEDYLFDLRGYLVLKGALTPDEVQRINQSIDAFPELEPGQWHGRVEYHGYSEVDGLNYQNIIEGGEVFEELIDHPSWIGHMRRYVDSSAHGMSIHESFINRRGPGQGLYMHSGGHYPFLLTTASHQDGEFHCALVNILVALTDVGPGDGATTVIPGSHKSKVRHPDVLWPDLSDINQTPALVEGAIEVHLQAGDALLFTDSICHGAVPRINDGERRILVYRYGPFWFKSRLGYEPSPEFLSRLTPERRAIIQPVPVRGPEA